MLFLILISNAALMIALFFAIDILTECFNKKCASSAENAHPRIGNAVFPKNTKECNPHDPGN